MTCTLGKVESTGNESEGDTRGIISRVGDKIAGGLSRRLYEREHKKDEVLVDEKRFGVSRKFLVGEDVRGHNRFYDRSPERRAYQEARANADVEGQKTGKPWECFEFAPGYPAPGSVVKIKGSKGVGSLLNMGDKIQKYSTDSVGKIGIVIHVVSKAYQRQAAERQGKKQPGTHWMDVYVTDIDPSLSQEQISKLLEVPRHEEGFRVKVGNVATYCIEDLEVVHEPTMATFHYAERSVRPKKEFYEENGRQYYEEELGY